MFYVVKILETAKQYREEGLKWFESYQLTKDDTRYEIAMSKYAHAEGLLEAYEILTDSEVGLHEIENELSNY